jgi:hypothetical protein
MWLRFLVHCWLLIPRCVCVQAPYVRWLLCCWVACWVALTRVLPSGSASPGQGGPSLPTHTHSLHPSLCQVHGPVYSLLCPGPSRLRQQRSHQHSICIHITEGVHHACCVNNCLCRGAADPMLCIQARAAGAPPAPCTCCVGPAAGAEGHQWSCLCSSRGCRWCACAQAGCQACSACVPHLPGASPGTLEVSCLTD